AGRLCSGWRFSALFCVSSVFFFFFQAEDGIRDWSVTGVQTCALPIWHLRRGAPVCRCAQRTGDLYRAPPLRSGRTLLLRPGARRARRNRRCPRRLCPSRGGRPHRAALSPLLYRPLEPAGPEAAREVGRGIENAAPLGKPLPPAPR